MSNASPAKNDMLPAVVVTTPTVDPVAVDRPDLPPAARRALAEAEARRQAAGDVVRQAELGGRNGPEPVRYGDWEKKGIAIDF